MGNKVFMDAAQAHPGDFFAQAKFIVSAQRPTGVSPSFTPRMQDWQQFQQAQERERRRQEQERIRQGEQNTRDQLNRQRSQADLQAKTIETGRQKCDELEQDMRTRELDKVADNIRNQWQAQGVPVKVDPFREPSVTLDGNGQIVRNASHVGYTVSYTYPDVETVTVQEFLSGSLDDPEGMVVTSSIVRDTHVTRTGLIKFGMAYLTGNERLTDKGFSGLIGPTNGLKALFVFNTYIPLAEPIVFQTDNIEDIQRRAFYAELDLMLNGALYISPASVLPDAQQRIRAYNPRERRVNY